MSLYAPGVSLRDSACECIQRTSGHLPVALLVRLPPLPAAPMPPLSKRDSLPSGNVSGAEFHQPNSPHAHKRYRYTHTYDGMNRLLQATYAWWNGTSYTSANDFNVPRIRYDKSGNITQMHRFQEVGASGDYFEFLKEDAMGIAPSPSNRVLTVRTIGEYEVKAEFAYDRNGNLRSMWGIYGNSTITYTRQNLPLQHTSGGAATNYRYDSAGLRAPGGGATRGPAAPDRAILYPDSHRSKTPRAGPAPDHSGGCLFSVIAAARPEALREMKKADLRNRKPASVRYPGRDSNPHVLADTRF
jgi:hypothetical protein